MHSIARPDGAIIYHVEAVSIRNVEIPSTDDLPKLLGSEDVMEVLLNYGGAFELRYSLRLVDTIIIDFREYMMLTACLPTGTWATYARYIRFANLLMKNKDLSLCFRV